MVMITSKSFTKAKDAYQQKHWSNSQYLKQKESVKSIKKKTKRARTMYSTEQLKLLEQTYSILKYPHPDKRQQLADYLNISEKSVKIWFQNRRMKEKKTTVISSPENAAEILFKIGPATQDSSWYDTNDYKQMNFHQYSDISDQHQYNCWSNYYNQQYTSNHLQEYYEVPMAFENNLSINNLHTNTYVQPLTVNNLKTNTQNFIEMFNEYCYL